MTPPISVGRRLSWCPMFSRGLADLPAVVRVIAPVAQFGATRPARHPLGLVGKPNVNHT